MQANKLKHIFNWRFYVLALILQADIIRFMHGSPFILESRTCPGEEFDGGEGSKGSETIKWLTGDQIATRNSQSV